MNLQKISSFHLFLSLAWGLLLGYSIYGQLGIPTGYQAILLPVNNVVSAGKRINLSVEIPRGFRSLPQPENATIHEFIPITDKNVYAWSQIITTQAFIGRAIDAYHLLQMNKERMLQAPDAKVIAESAHDYGTYATAMMIISYVNPKQNRQEIALISYYSGPYDCSGFQYTIAMIDNKSEASVVKQLKDFADKRITLIK